VLGKGEVVFGLGPVGVEEAGAIGIGTTSDGESQPEDAVEGRDRAEVVVVSMGPVLTVGAVEREGSQGSKFTTSLALLE
jgi:hypothetical protein